MIFFCLAKLKAELGNGQNLIQKYTEELEKTRLQVIRIDGAIQGLEELLGESKGSDRQAEKPAVAKKA